MFVVHYNESISIDYKFAISSLFSSVTSFRRPTESDGSVSRWHQYSPAYHQAIPFALWNDFKLCSQISVFLTRDPIRSTYSCEPFHERIPFLLLPITLFELESSSRRRRRREERRVIDVRSSEPPSAYPWYPTQQE
jgi:hypothetical protein